MTEESAFVNFFSTEALEEFQTWICYRNFDKIGKSFADVGGLHLFIDCH